MKKLLKLVAVAVSAALLLTGCSSGKDNQRYVKGLLDTYCYGEFKDYMELTDSTEAEAQELYDSNKEDLAVNLGSYFGMISDLPDVDTRLNALAEQLLKKAKYTVDKSEKVDGKYHVPVTVEPIDFFKIIDADVVAYIDKFNTRIDEGEFDDLSDEEFENEYAVGLLDIIEPYVEKIGYSAPVDKDVEIQEDSEGYYIADEDFSDLYISIFDFDFEDGESVPETEEAAS